MCIRDSICTDRRNIYADLSFGIKRKSRDDHAGTCVGNRSCRYGVKSILGNLSEMVFFYYIYCNGLDLSAGI